MHLSTFLYNIINVQFENVWAKMFKMSKIYLDAPNLIPFLASSYDYVFMDTMDMIFSFNTVIPNIIFGV